ncbi:interferon lambda-3-like [Bufo bufo]|uniref:interferon lambda-3-like n=1 Tax=Bufo bufo TaxID=8384 RepID=UPI001ABE25F7|nr:interferon lambda-3-like [Bufo bufo]
MTGVAAGFASEAMMIEDLSLDVLIFENYYTRMACVSPFMVYMVSCEGFKGGEESLQIDTNTPAMDVRLVVFCILFVAVTGHPHKRRCSMSRYKSVSSTDIKMIKGLQNEHEKDISTSAMKCYRRMMRHKPSVCDLNPSDRLILTLKRVTITAEILANLATSDVLDPVSQSLMMFLKIRDDLLICRESSEYSSTPSEELMPWLHHLQQFLEEASPQCLQDAVLLSLISLMVEDVGCWAHVK